MSKLNRIILLVAWVFMVSSMSVFSAIELPELLRPHLVRVNGDRMYVADEATVHIYNLAGFSHGGSFGKQGEGPGEIKNFIYGIDFNGEHLLVTSSGRISWFTREGGFVRQRAIPSLGVHYQRMRENYVAMRMVRDRKAIAFTIIVMDTRFNVKRELYRFPHPFFNRKQLINAADVRVSSYGVAGNRIVLDAVDGEIDVFDGNGNLTDSWNPPYRPPVIGEKQRRRLLDWWQTGLKAEYEVFQERLRFPDRFPPVRDLLVRDERVYVLTFEEHDGRNVMFVYDLDGRMVRRALVPMTETNTLLPHLFRRYEIAKGILYLLADDLASETWGVSQFPLN